MRVRDFLLTLLIGFLLWCTVLWVVYTATEFVNSSLPPGL